MKFEKPVATPNISSALFQVALGLAKLQFQDPVSSAGSFKDAWTKLWEDSSRGPETTAWIFLASCVATASNIVLTAPRLHTGFTETELKDCADKLMDRIPIKGELSWADLTNLARSRILEDCIDEFVNIAADATKQSGPIEEKEARQRFGEALAQSTTKVFAQDPNKFKVISETVFGPLGINERRDLEWQRHSAWISSQFIEEPIFSPDDDIDIPLSQVYLPLRCFWNEEKLFDPENTEEAKSYRTAVIADLNSVVLDWLENATKKDPIRLITGGPGSGKSSFAKSFAHEVVKRDTHRVLFINLQRMQISDSSLQRCVDAYFKKPQRTKTPHKSERFEISAPLETWAQDSRPLLLVFDGLDELTASEDHAKEIAQKFVSKLRDMVRDLTSSDDPQDQVRALVLGRNIAMDPAREDANIPIEALLNVAPIQPIDRDILLLGSNPSDRVIGENPVKDPMDLMDKDQRKIYWRKWETLHGRPTSPIPEACTATEMKDLNVEPLLLHLLIISGYVKERWKEAAENRNLVYKDILSKVFHRNKKKELDAFQKLEEEHFFELMEVFGLAAFQGNGRTGDHESFEELRRKFSHPENEYLYEEIAGAELKNVALMVHARHSIEGAGFEFVHKSFGEYLAARSLVYGAQKLSDRLNNKHVRDREPDLAKTWTEWVGPGRLTDPIFRFLKDEIKGEEIRKNADSIVESLTRIFDHALHNGFPVHNKPELQNSTFRELELHQRRAEKAMLTILTSLWSVGERENRISLTALKQKRSAALNMCHRLRESNEGYQEQRFSLAGLDLEGAELSGVNLFRADLTGSNLSEASLHSANLAGAILTGVDLSYAMVGSLIFGQDDAPFFTLFAGANLTGADLTGAELNNTYFHSSDLSDATLRNAHIYNTALKDVTLDGATLVEIKQDPPLQPPKDEYKVDVFDGSSLLNVDLSDCADLTQEQLNSAFGASEGVLLTKIPSHLEYPEHWFVSAAKPQDNFLEKEKYQAAFLAWRTKTKEESLL